MMSRRIGPIAVLALAVALGAVLAACGTGLVPGDPVREPGAREWIITVDNQSVQPGRLFVARG